MASFLIILFSKTLNEELAFTRGNMSSLINITDLDDLINFVLYYPFNVTHRNNTFHFDPHSSKKNIAGTPTKQITNRMSPTMGGGGSSSSGGVGTSADSFGDRQFMVITSEKTARVLALPSQNCVYRQQITDTDYVVKAEIISLKGTVQGWPSPITIYVRLAYGTLFMSACEPRELKLK